MNSDDKKDKRDPYNAEDTPTPPQVMDPNDESARNPKESGNRKPEPTDARGQDRPNKDSNEASTGKNHLLSDEADISDETTI
jgi:hypothetical protein